MTQTSPRTEGEAKAKVKANKPKGLPSDLFSKAICFRCGSFGSNPKRVVEIYNTVLQKILFKVNNSRTCWSSNCSVCAQSVAQAVQAHTHAQSEPEALDLAYYSAAFALFYAS